MELNGREQLRARRRTFSSLQIPMLLGWVVPYAVSGGDVHPLWLAEFALQDRGGGVYLLLPAYLWALSIVYPTLFLIPNLTAGREHVSEEWLQKCDGLLLLLMFMGLWTLWWMVCNPTAWFGGFYPDEEVGTWVIGPMIGFAFFSLVPALYVLVAYVSTVLSPTDMDLSAKADASRRDGDTVAENEEQVAEHVQPSNFWDNVG